MSKSESKKFTVPTKEEMQEWIIRDLQAASYFLNMLQRYPEVVKLMANDMHAHAMAKENGAAVDHLTAQQIETEKELDKIQRKEELNGVH